MKMNRTDKFTKAMYIIGGVSIGVVVSSLYVVLGFPDGLIFAIFFGALIGSIGACIGKLERRIQELEVSIQKNSSEQRTENQDRK